MTIKLKSGEQLDLPVDFSVEISRINPFFSEYGEHSIPVQLPPSPNNARLLGFPHDVGMGTIKTSFDVTLQDGIFFYPAKMSLLSANESEGYECNFVLNLGQMYSALQADKLSAVVEKQYTRLDYTTAIAAMLHLEDVARKNEMTDEDLIDIFPVLADAHILNEYQETTAHPGRVFAAYRDRTIDIDGQSTVIPAGFLLTPFLRLRPLLARVFKHYGYKVVDWGALSEHPYRDMVLLNHNYDTVANGYITPLQLAPDCSVSDLLSAVEGKFLSRWVVDESTTSIRFVHFDSLLSGDSTDMTDRLAGKPTFSYPVRYRRLELKSASYIRPSFPKGVDNESFEQTENLKETLKKRFGLCVDVRTGILYRYMVLRDMSGKLLAVGSLIADYIDEHKSYDPEVVDCGDTVPAMQLPLADTAFSDVAIPQVGEGRWLNSFCRLSDGKEDKEDRKGELPVMFALPVGRPGGLRQGGLIDAASQRSLLYHGEQGLFALFGKKYDELFRYGLTEAEVPVQMRGVDKMTLSATRPIIVSGNRFLPESIDYSTQADSISVLKLRSLTMKPHLSSLDAEYLVSGDYISSLKSTMSQLPTHSWSIERRWRFSLVPEHAPGSHVTFFADDMYECPSGYDFDPGPTTGLGNDYPANTIYYWGDAINQLSEAFKRRGDRVVPAPTPEQIATGGCYVYAVSQIKTSEATTPPDNIEPDPGGGNGNNPPNVPRPDYFVLYFCLKVKAL